MSQKCVLTGRKPAFGNQVSFSNRKTRRMRRPNIQDKNIFVPELGRAVRLRLSTAALRTLNKKGLMQFLRDEGMTLRDIGVKDVSL